jgi:hypothetical protein
VLGGCVRSVVRVVVRMVVMRLMRIKFHRESAGISIFGFPEGFSIHSFGLIGVAYQFE